MSRLSSFLIVVVAVLILTLLRACGKFETLEMRAKSYRNLSRQEKQKAEVWKDKAGRYRARAKVAESTAEVLREHIPELEGEIKGLKKNLSNLENYTTSTTTTSGSIETVLVDTVIITKTDTVFAKTFTYTDTWSKFNGSITNNEIKFKYSVRDSISFYQYWRRGNILRKKELVLEGVSYNPSTKITGISNIKIMQPKNKKISVGPTISYGLGSDGNFAWSVGIGVQYKLFQF